MRICIDAGHGLGYNPSPADSRYSEGTQMFLLQSYLKSALEEYGFEVVCTRSRIEESPSLYDRAAFGRGCDLLLSLHTNAVGSEVNDNVDYVCVFYPVSGDKEDLAQALSELIASVMGTKQLPQIRKKLNSAGTADYYGILRHAAENGTSALLLEQSFHTNSAVTRWLLNEENLRRLADAQAALLAEYFGLEEFEMRFERVKDVKNPFYRPTIDKLINKEILQGKAGTGEDTVIDLSEDAIRLLVMLDRTGIFDEK